MISIKNLPTGLSSLAGITEIILFCYALFCLIQPSDTTKTDPNAWVHASIAFGLSRVMARRRGAETWVSVIWQATIFAFFSYIILNR